MSELNIEQISKSLPKSLEEQWNQLLGETIINTKKLTVCIVGAFSVGKSSLINMLINKNILPQALKETTTLPTFIEYGSQLEMSLTDSSGNTRNTDIEAFQKTIISKGEPGSFASLNVPESWLKDIFLIDLPGTGSTEQAKADFTNTQIKTSDVIFYMIPPRGPDKNDLQLLKKVHILGKKIIILAAQWDIAQEAHKNNEQLPDLQEWEDIIHEHTGIKASVIPSSKTGIGREQILKLLTDLGMEQLEIRIKRFQTQAVPLLTNAIEILEQENRFLHVETGEKAESLRAEIREKRDLLLKLRKEINSKELSASQDMEKETEKLKIDIADNLKHQLENWKTELLEKPDKKAWDFFLAECNQYSDQMTNEAALRFRQLYDKYGESPVLDEEFKPLHFQFPRPYNVEPDNFLYETQLHFLADQINMLKHEIEQGKQNLPDTAIDRTRLNEYMAQIQGLHKERQQLENTAVPMIPQEVGGSNMGKFIGRIFGEAADIGLMFIQPEIVGAKIASYVGKGAKTLKVSVDVAKVAKTVSTGTKALQATKKGMQLAQNRIETTPTEHVIEKTQILEKLCLGYWGERFGGFFDPEPQTVWTPDPEFFEQKNNALIQYRNTIHGIQQKQAEIQREIDEKELTQYQVNKREEKLQGLQFQKQEIEHKISIQKQQARKEAEKQFHESVAKCADQAIRNFVYTFDKKAYHMLKLLNETFRDYWQNEIKNAMDEHEKQLDSLEMSLKMFPDERRKNQERINMNVNILKAELNKLN